VNAEEIYFSMITAKPSRQSARAVKQAISTFDAIRQTIVTREKYAIY